MGKMPEKPKEEGKKSQAFKSVARNYREKMEEGFKTKSKSDFYSPNYTHVSPNTKNPVQYKENKMS